MTNFVITLVVAYVLGGTPIWEEHVLERADGVKLATAAQCDIERLSLEDTILQSLKSIGVEKILIKTECTEHKPGQPT